jgi:pseudo-rSAM protein
MNTNFFGALYIYPDGTVKANPNTASIGKLIDTDILQIAETELIKNSAWRKIRDQEPCCQCLYQFLCPSPSNYEFAIGRPNLCHVKP